jgi:flagellar hook-associated protein 1 FlgK
MYTLVSNGVSLVNGVNKLTLSMTPPQANDEYDINDYDVLIRESQVTFLDHEAITRSANTPYSLLNGSLRADFEAINECKKYIDDLANMASFLLSDFNEQHQNGCGVDSDRTSGINFFGDSMTMYTWDATDKVLKAQKYTANLSATGHTIKTNKNYAANDPNYYYVKSTVSGGTADGGNDKVNKIDAINALRVSTQITAAGGEALIAAAGYGFECDSAGVPTDITNPKTIYSNGTGDGYNAVMISTLFNLDMSKTPKYSDQDTTEQNEAKRAIGSISLNAYYNKSMTGLGSDAETYDSKVEAQEEIMTQLTEWRESTAGVNWNQELTNMIMFQQGYMSCARCLTTMDEMLDKLINGTGVVGR